MGLRIIGAEPRHSALADDRAGNHVIGQAVADPRHLVLRAPGERAVERREEQQFRSAAGALQPSDGVRRARVQRLHFGGKAEPGHRICKQLRDGPLLAERTRGLDQPHQPIPHPALVERRGSALDGIAARAV